MKKRARIESITSKPVKGKVLIILTVFDSTDPEVTHRQSVYINTKFLEKDRLTMKKIMQRLEIVEKQRKRVKDVEINAHDLIGKMGEFEARS